METVEVERGDKICVFCKRGTVDEVNLGKLYARDDVACHYYCLLFVSNLPQNGKNDNDGIMGFLLADIRKEVRRVVANKRNKSFYKCAYCRKEGATIGCCVKKCKKIFHFPCGLTNGADFKFSETFDAFCLEHARLPVLKYRPPQDNQCPICNCNFDLHEAPVSSNGNRERGVILGTCCAPTWYHKLCLQKYALSAGLHAFKCPKCNSKELNIQVQTQGVYLPDQDASWEMEENAFEDLYVGETCDSDPCLCVKGRNFKGDIGSDWQLIVCSHCGATCTHQRCGGVAAGAEATWLCVVCRDLESVQAKRARYSSQMNTYISNNLMHFQKWLMTFKTCPMIVILIILIFAIFLVVFDVL